MSYHGRACVCERCWRQRWRPANEGTAPLDLLDERILKQTLRLVHPDAQPEGRRELATVVTQRLLSALETIRRRGLELPPEIPINDFGNAVSELAKSQSRPFPGGSKAAWERFREREPGPRVIRTADAPKREPLLERLG